MDATLRSRAARSWAFRWGVEREAAQRFASFARRYAALGAPPVLRELAERAAADEDRHRQLCGEQARRLGEPVDDALPVTVALIAPASLSEAERFTYEVVAACCIAETESTGTLTTLLAGDVEPEVRAVVHEIARDEVQHARLGWAHLAAERSIRDLAFLGPLVPAMLNSGVELFRPPPDLRDEAPELIRWGVLAHAQKRAVFVEVMREVILPGFEQLGVPTAPARAWLAARLAE